MAPATFETWPEPATTDRTGQITARLDCGPFVDDLIALLGFESMAELIAAGEESS